MHIKLFQTSFEKSTLNRSHFRYKMATVVILKIQEQVYCIKRCFNMDRNYRYFSIKRTFFSDKMHVQYF